MSGLPIRFRALFTRRQLAEMLARTYAAARDVDVNEAYLRLESGLSEVTLLDGLQTAMWRALSERRPRLDADALIDLAGRKLSRARRFGAVKKRNDDEGPIAAVMVLIDRGAGLSSGEALDLLESEGGRTMLAAGFARIGEHLAQLMLAK